MVVGNERRPKHDGRIPNRGRNDRLRPWPSDCHAGLVDEPCMAIGLHAGAESHGRVGLGSGLGGRDRGLRRGRMSSLGCELIDVSK